MADNITSLINEAKALFSSVNANYKFGNATTDNMYKIFQRTFRGIDWEGRGISIMRDSRSDAMDLADKVSDYGVGSTLARLSSVLSKVIAHFDNSK